MVSGLLSRQNRRPETEDHRGPKTVDRRPVPCCPSPRGVVFCPVGDPLNGREKTGASGTGVPSFVASLPAGAVPAVRWQRLCRAHLRDRVVPAPAAGRRRHGDLARHPAGHLHGRHVRGEPAAAPPGAGRSASAARLCVARARPRRTGAHRARCAAGAWPGVRRQRRVRIPRDCGPRALVCGLSPAAHAPDGRHAAGDRALG